jgi:hypothetical protein
MKRLSSILIFLSFVLFMFETTTVEAQEGKPRPSLNASVTQIIGADTDITIVYSRPGVKGRKIWGDLVPYGLAPGNRYSKDKPFPWRAGANENTTIEFKSNLLIEGQKISAGKYSIHMIPSEKDWVVIFNKKNDGWGSFAYNQEEDALRVTVTPVKTTQQEWLLYGFEDLGGTSATCYLHWEKVKVPFKVKLSE